jgi:arylsulfatase A
MKSRALMGLIALSTSLLAAFALPAFAAEDSPKPAAERMPNVVVFLTDDQGWGDLGCYGHPVIQSPHLDRFAEQGLKFNQAYAASGVCSPSRSAILTGRSPYRNGVFTWIPEESPVHLRQSEVSIASLLRERGYGTCHVGKWHLNGGLDSAQPQPSDHGFDWWFATQNNAFPNHINPENFFRNGEPVGRLEGASAVLVVQEGIEWLKTERRPDQPFYLNVWTHEPHLPIESAPKYLAMYPEIDDEDLKQHHANVTQLDDAFGILMAALEELGETENTLVIFTSDNGPEGDGERGRTRGSTGGLRGRKRDVYEGGIRVPMLVRWPGRIEPGSTSDEPVIGADIFATLCELTGIPLPDDRTIDAVSMVPAFEGKPLERTAPLYWRCNLHRDGTKEIAVRQGDWKLILSHDTLRFELYNIREDPREQRDLSMRNPEVMDRLARAFWEMQTGIDREGYRWPEVKPWEWNVRLRRAMQGPPARGRR